MRSLQWETIDEMLVKLAKRVQNIRKRKKLSQEELAEISGVSFGSVKRFETTGNISLISLTKIAVVLDCADEIRNMFSNIEYKDIEELLNEQK